MAESVTLDCELLSAAWEPGPRSWYDVLDYCRRGVVESDRLARRCDLASVRQYVDVHNCNLDCACPGLELIGHNFRHGRVDFETMELCRSD